MTHSWFDHSFSKWQPNTETKLADSVHCINHQTQAAPPFCSAGQKHRACRCCPFWSRQAAGKWPVLEAAWCSVSFYQMGTTPRHLGKILMVEMRSSQSLILCGNNPECQQIFLWKMECFILGFKIPLLIYFQSSCLWMTLKRLERHFTNPRTVVN